MSNKIIVFLLFFLPFLILPIGPSFFETPKIYVYEIAIVLLFTFYFFRTPKKSQMKQKNSKPIDNQNYIKKIGLFLFTSISLLTFLNLCAYPTSLTFFGNQYRHQGVLLLWLLLLFSFLSGQTKLLRISYWFILILTIVELFCAIFFLMTIDRRAVGTLGEPNALAAFIVFLLPFLVFNQSNTALSKTIIIFTSLLILTIIFLSGSRSGLIAFCIFFLFFVLQHYISLNKAVIIVIVVSLCSFVLPFFQSNVIYENRTEVWKSALLAGYAKPIFGWSFGNTEVALHEYDKKLYNNEQGYYVDSSHNIFLDWWVEGGFVGLSLFVLTVYSSFRSLVTRKNVRELGLLISTLLCLSFNPASIVLLVGFWWIIGRSLFAINEI